jgi:hypothetical protein
LEGVRVIRYGFGFPGVVVWDSEGDIVEVALAVVVDTFAIPKNRSSVDGRGRAIGLRKRSGTGEAIMLGMSCLVLPLELKKTHEVAVALAPKLNFALMI